MISASRIIALAESLLRLEERNVLNLDDIEKFLKDVERGGEWSQESSRWLQKRVRLYLINDYPHILNTYISTSHIPNEPMWARQALERGEKLYDIDLRTNRSNALFDQVLLIMEFLNSSAAPKRIDALSYEQAETLATKWYGEQLKARVDKQDLEDVQTVKELSGGMRWVRILTKLSLDREGKEMHHCLDQGHFNPDDDTQYYSLRDSRNKPHATIEFGEGIRFISQIKGYGNGPIEDEYLDACRDFINTYLKPDDIDETDLVNILSVFDRGKVREGMGAQSVAILLSADNYNKSQMEKALAKLGGRVNEPVEVEGFDDGVALIIVAIFKGDAFLVKRLVQAGADLKECYTVSVPWHRGPIDLTPLMLACLMSSDENVDLKPGYEEIIRDLIPGSNLEQADPNYYETPLFMMYSYELNDLFELMLKKGADPNHESLNHRTPLIAAIEDGNEDRVAVLIQYGAKVEEEHLELAENEDKEEIAVMLAKVLGITDYEYEGN
jgi:hypothetical protein